MNTKILMAIAALIAALSVCGGARGAEKNFVTLFEDKLEKTEGLTACADGRLFVAEQSGKVYEISVDDKLTLFRDGLDFPAGLACGKDGKLYALEYKAGNVMEISKDGKEVKKLAGGFRSLNGAVVKLDGTVFVSESDAGKISEINPKDGSVKLLAGDVMYANGLVLSDDESILYAASTTGGKVYAIPLTGENRGKKKLYAGKLQMVDGLTKDGEGNLYACLFSAGKVAKLSPGGASEIIAEGMTTNASPAYVDRTVSIPEIEKPSHKYAYLYISNLGGKGIYKVTLSPNSKDENGSEGADASDKTGDKK